MTFADVIMVVVVTTLLMIGLLYPWFEDSEGVDNLFEDNYK